MFCGLLKWNLKIRNQRLLRVSNWNGSISNLVAVPRSKDINRLRRNNRKYQWIDDILCALAGNDSLSDDEYQETLTKLLVSIGKDHEEVFREVAELLGMKSIPQIDAATSFSIQLTCNIGVR